MSSFSDVHNAKLCLLATIFGCLDAALTIAAALNNKSVFISPFGREVEANTIRRSFSAPDEHSDFLLIYRAYRSWRANCENGNWSSFCRKHFISHQVSVLQGVCAIFLTALIAEHGTTRGAEGTIPGKPAKRWLYWACKRTHTLWTMPSYTLL